MLRWVLGCLRRLRGLGRRRPQVVQAPVQHLDRISDKWASLVVSALAPGPLRYSDLGRKIAGVSPKMLTQTLHSLERDGLLTRTVTPSVPVRVDYALTPLGQNPALLPTAVKDWAENHFDEVRHARERYDAESADA